MQARLGFCFAFSFAVAESEPVWKGTPNGEPLPDFYHNSDQLHDELQRLAESCPGLTLERLQPASEPRAQALRGAAAAGLALDAVRLRLPRGGIGPRRRVAVVSGEHAREIIGTEIVLNLLRALCGEADLGAGSNASDASLDRWAMGPGADLAARIGSDVEELLVVANANPLSRRRVEAGEFCLRGNPNGVDLNRNWDMNWTQSLEENQGYMESSGTGPFSEDESALLRDALAAFRPTHYLSVHSGNVGIYVPYAHTKTPSLRLRKEPDLLAEVTRAYCPKCQFGPAAKTIGYPADGTSIDYVFDKLNAQHSFALETFLGQAWDRFLKLYARPERRRSTRHSFGHRARALFHVKTETTDPEEVFYCQDWFNPVSRSDYDDVLLRWTKAMLALMTA